MGSRPGEDPAGGRISGSLRGLLRALGVAVAYYVAARLSLHVSLVRENVTPVWPPTGIAVVALLAFGYRVLPGIALAAFAVNLPISPSPLAAALIAVGNTGAPLVAVVCCAGPGSSWRWTGRGTCWPSSSSVRSGECS